MPIRLRVREKVQHFPQVMNRCLVFTGHVMCRKVIIITIITVKIIFKRFEFVISFFDNCFDNHFILINTTLYFSPYFP